MTRGVDRPELPQDLTDLPLRPEPKRPENLSLFGEEGRAKSLAGGLPAPDLAPLPEDDSERASAAPAVSQLDLDDAAQSEPSPAQPGGVEPVSATGSASENVARRPAFVQFLLAGVADLVVHVGVLSLAVLAMATMGLRPELDQWPGFAAFALLFSFLYTTIPLAFWGQSPGMAWSGVRARDADDRPLTFGQTALRWLASLLSVVLLGTPLLIALSGRSLADRLSGSWTLRAAPSA